MFYIVHMTNSALIRIIALTILTFSIISVNISFAADGKGLYIKNCASCHGADGEGGKGPSLNKQGLLSVASEIYFVKSILYGRPTRGCPPRKDLSKDETVSIASFIKKWQKVESISLPVKKIQPALSERGKQIFELCTACHDTGGVGAMGPSLIDPGFQASASDTFLRATIMYGREGTPMNGFLKQKEGVPGLSEEDIDEVVAYIRYLGNNKENKGN